MFSLTVQGASKPDRVEVVGCMMIVVIMRNRYDLSLGSSLVDSFTSLIPRFELSRVRHQSEPWTQSYTSIQQNDHVPSSYQRAHRTDAEAFERQGRDCYWSRGRVLPISSRSKVCRLIALCAIFIDV